MLYLRKLELLFLALCGCMSVMACSHTTGEKQVNVDSVFNKSQKAHEWISFDVYHSGLDRHGKMGYRYLKGRVYVHNLSDSVQHLAFVYDEAACLITPDTVYMVDFYHQDIAQYPRLGAKPEFYEELLMDHLQTTLEYFPMFADAYHDLAGHVSYPDDPSKYSDVGSHIRMDATIVQKHCYPDYCELVDCPLSLFFNRATQLFDSAYTVQGRERNVITLNNFSFSDASALVDSLFDFSHYPAYYRTPTDQFLQSRTVTSNTRMNDTLLHHPLVNLATGDTLRLADMKGYTLLYFSHFDADETYRTMQQFRGEVDHIVWLEPASDNVALLRRLADSLHYGNDVYCTKHFLSLLNEYKGIYLLSPEHQVAGYVGKSYIPNPKLSIKSLLKRAKK